MARETKAEKAGRYLLEGRVIVVHVSQRHGVVANVRGDGHVYETTWRDGVWRCNCPHRAATASCSHVIALRRIVAVDLEDGRHDR